MPTIESKNLVTIMIVGYSGLFASFGLSSLTVGSPPMSAFAVDPVFSTPPSPLRENDSRFSPTSDGVFEPTEPVDMVVRVLVVLPLEYTKCTR